MGNRLNRIACAILALLVIATGWAFAEASPAAPERDIVVLFTSDVHCGVDQGFGYVGLKAIRDALEREGNDVLLVDNGDAIQGEAIGVLTQGQAIIGLMNQIGYDVAIPGNHEFDYGNEMSDIVDDRLAWVNEQLGSVVAQSAVGLTINDPNALDDAGKPVRIIRCAETNLGDLIADAFRVRSGAEVGVACAGSIRKGLPKGSVTLSDVLSTYPFDNGIVMARVTGQQILNALEWGARMVPEESGSFLQVSGMTYEIHTDIPSGCKNDENGLFTGVEGEYRVKNVMIGGEPLEPDRLYTLASQGFTLLNHGDGQTAFDGARTIWQSDVPDYGVVAAYLLEDLNGIVGEDYADPYGQGRIVAVG